MEKYKLFEKDMHAVLISCLHLYFSIFNTENDDKMTF